MKENINHANVTSVASVNFQLTPEKQHLLIWLMKNYSPLTLKGLAKMLNSTEDKLTDVLKQQEYLSTATTEKLIRFFCVWCGN